MAVSLTPTVLKKHFHDLTAKGDKIRAKLDPLRDELNGLADSKLSHKDALKREAEIRPEIVKLQQQLAPIENERAMVSRALGGKTGQP